MNLKKIQNISSRFAGRLLDLSAFLNGYNPLPPAFVLLILTYDCDMSCDFCSQKRRRKNLPSEMTLEEACAIENNIRRSFKIKPRIHLFGGEPAMNSDFGGILRYFSEKDYRISLTTNGMGIDKYADALFRAKGLKEINLSCNTGDVNRTISLLRDFARGEQRKKIRVNLSCTITKLNQSCLAEIMRRFESCSVDSVTFQHQMFTDHDAAKITPAVLVEQMEEIGRSKYKVPVIFFPDIKMRDIPAYYNNPDFPGDMGGCVFPWFTLCVQPDGDVTPCDIIPCDEINVVMGNAKRDELKRVWNSGRFKEFRKKIQRRSLVSLFCRRCCHRYYD